MIKTDLRHTNNTRANKNLHLEMDLWIAYQNSNKQPVLISIAKSTKTKGSVEDAFFELYYSPSDLNKNRPYLLIGTNNDWRCRYENIQQAKYYLKTQYSNVKWQRKNKINETK